MNCYFFRAGWLAVIWLIIGCVNAQTQMNPVALQRSVYAAAQKQFVASPILSKKIPQALLQVCHPRSNECVGTGVLLTHQHKLLAVFPRHIVGTQGRIWRIRLTDKTGRIHHIPVEILRPYSFDPFLPDVAWADLSHKSLPPVASFEMGNWAAQAALYSVGYIRGEVDMGNFLPLKRQVLFMSKWEMTTDRVIPGLPTGDPFALTGYCGAPLIQQQEGKWKVVAIHTGSCGQTYGGEVADRASAVSLVPAFSAVENAIRPVIGKRFIAWNQQKLAALSPLERVTYLQVERNETLIFSRELPPSFLPEETAAFLDDKLVVQPDDVLMFTVTRPDGTEYTLKMAIQ